MFQFSKTFLLLFRTVNRVLNAFNWLYKFFSNKSYKLQINKNKLFGNVASRIKMHRESSFKFYVQIFFSIGVQLFQQCT